MPPLEPFSTQSIIDSHDPQILKSNVGRNHGYDKDLFTKYDVPKLTEIRKILPKNCFSPSVLKSFQFVIRDLAFVLILFLSYLYIDLNPSVPLYIKTFIILPIYAFLQGTMFWAIFVLGHDCGHGSFSKYGLLNDIVGTFLHTLILVPYTNWKLSHRHHHKNTGNIDKDEVYFPIRKSEYEQSKLIPYFGFGLGWLIYLMVGYGTRAQSHLNPFNPLYSNHRVGAIISITSVAIMLSSIFYASTIWGWITMIKYYFLPWLIFSSWLVITTFLHHHGAEENIKLPWFSNDEWSYVVGNLSSVDRDYGILHDVTHNIGTHQIHHLFPIIPHYYLKDATKVFQSYYPQFKRESNEPILNIFISTFNVWKSQYLVDDDTKIFLYNKNSIRGKKVK